MERNKNAHHWAVFVLNLHQTGSNVVQAPEPPDEFCGRIKMTQNNTAYQCLICLILC
jgi:hypothetical protein